MPRYTQANRPLRIDTPLGPDALLLEKMVGTEAISEPFHLQLDLLAEAPVDFDRLLGEKAAITLALDNGVRRFIHGIIQSLTMGTRLRAANGTTLIRYQAELVPELWLLSRRMQSRIFQQKSVRDILTTILHDEWQLEVEFRFQNIYQARNYCVQYRESDLAFVSRLMEDEGISYYFEHEDKRHLLVVADHPVFFTDMPQFKSVAYTEQEGATQREPRIRRWEKRQELCSPKYTLRDYCFEMPANDLTGLAELNPDTKVTAGKAGHRLSHQRVNRDVKLFEVYDYPGQFAHRFDGIAPQGGDDLKQSELQKIIADKDRTARLRLEEEAARSMRIKGGGDCGHFLPGHIFSLEQHFDGESAGNPANVYLLTRIEHSASLEGAYTGTESHFVYENRFECLPFGLTYRPPRQTPKPRIEGPQTAVVVGPRGEPIFLDRYGRVKVKFHWDRDTTVEGVQRSCWVRVAQPWAGKGWGAFFWPRVGHEVVVSFEDGDPDRPLITGSVYNAENQPALTPSQNQSSAGFKSCSMGGNPLVHFNSFVFHDIPGDEHVQMHSETHEMFTSKGSKYLHTPGPSVEFAGSLPLPVGSGSGGGWLEWAELGDITGHKHSALMMAMPGKATFTCGEKFDCTMMGTRMTHITGAGDVKLVFDVESLIEHGLATAFPTLTPLLALGLGVGGTTDLIVGPRTTTIYPNPLATNPADDIPIIDVRRGQTYEYRMEKAGHHITAATVLFHEAAKVFAVLTVLTATVGDILARSLGTMKQKKDSHELDLEIPKWAPLVSGNLAGRLHAFLVLFETHIAFVQAGKGDDSHLGHCIHAWQHLFTHAAHPEAHAHIDAGADPVEDALVLMRNDLVAVLAAGH